MRNRNKGLVVLFATDEYELIMLNDYYGVRLLDSKHNMLVTFQSLNAAKEWLEKRYGGIDFESEIG